MKTGSAFGQVLFFIVSQQNKPPAMPV